MNKIYNNKTAYDPGRFRYPVKFLQEDTTIAPDGSNSVSNTLILQTKAVREAVTRRFNLSGDITIEAGANLMNNYWYFTIRYRKGFMPKKDMMLIAPDGVYTIAATPELDEPPHYWKMLCFKTDKAITT